MAAILAPARRQVNVSETQSTSAADSATILAVRLLVLASNDVDVLDTGGHNLFAELQKQAGSGNEIEVDGTATPSATVDRRLLRRHALPVEPPARDGIRIASQDTD